MPSLDNVIYTQDGAVATIVLNRPTVMNAFNAALRDDLRTAFALAASDASVRAVVFSGSGKGFCSGADLSEEYKPGQTSEDALNDEYLPIMELIGTMEKPVIAAINGVAVGIGASFALHCDLVVMADTARLKFAFSDIALVPDGGAHQLLIRRLGYQRAYQLFAEGGSLSATQCQEAGFANVLAPAEDVLVKAQAWADCLSRRPSISLGFSKRVLRQAQNMEFEQVFREEARLQSICAESPEFRAAVDKFMRKE